jgi:hypothetical protein
LSVSHSRLRFCSGSAAGQYNCVLKTYIIVYIQRNSRIRWLLPHMSYFCDS